MPKVALLTIILLLTMLPACLFAQRLNGRLIDRYTKQPIAFANIVTAASSTSSSADGTFVLSNLHPGDEVVVSSVGYKLYKFNYSNTKPDTITIYLSQFSVVLRDVTVRGGGGYKSDSLRNRKDFASVFNDKGTTFNDIFITRDYGKYVPYNYIDAPHSTATLLSVDLLQVASLLGKNKAPETKLQKTLIADEQGNYVDHVFSRQKVIAITSLKGDSLRDFMNDYRPAVAQVKKMTDYDMVLYIKKSYGQFLKSYKPGSGNRMFTK